MATRASALLPPTAALAAVGGLAWAAPAQAGSLILRLAPVLLFVAAMSVVVNLAADAGTFDAVAAWARRRSWAGLPIHVAAWCQTVLLALVATVFLSLDTTAILVTPLALAIARRAGVSTWATALTVIWIANLGSLLLPVSNLTNLLAAGSNVFDGPTAYTAAAWLPAAVAAGVAVTAAALVFRFSARTPPPPAHATGEPAPSDPRLRTCLLALAVLLPLLASPVPYWLSAGVAALLLIGVSIAHAPRSVTAALVPWRSLSFVTVLSAVAAAAHATGATSWIADQLAADQYSTGGLLTIAGTGAVLANLVNNIPAFLALEVGVDTPHGMLALLIGVNAGPIITPWASLATLLWHDQLRRGGAEVSWWSFIRAGLVLAPIAVISPVLAIGW